MTNYLLGMLTTYLLCGVYLALLAVEQVGWPRGALSWLAFIITIVLWPLDLRVRP